MRSVAPTALMLAACAGLLWSRAEAAVTAWVGTDRVAVRLVTGADTVGSDAIASAGLEFRYGEGWHGYWRTPGDAGIAPRLDWTASRNLAGVDVSWPAPRRLETSGLQSAIYIGDVILPLTVRLATPGAPIRLALALDYAACANICVPVHADLALTLPGGDGAPSLEAAALAAARRTLPVRLDDAGFDLKKVDVTTGHKPPKLSVILHSRGAPFTHPDLFVELPNGGLPPAPAVVLSDSGQTASFTTPLPEGSGAAAPAFTVVDGARAVEVPASAVEPASAGQTRSR